MTTPQPQPFGGERRPEGDLGALREKVAAATVRIDTIAELLEQNRAAISRTEERMVGVVDNLATRLEKITEDIHEAVKDTNVKTSERLSKLEQYSTQLSTTQKLLAFFLPVCMTVAFFLYDGGAKGRLSHEDVLELKAQLSDLRRHRRLGGTGQNWLSPSRRDYTREQYQNDPLPDNRDDF